MLNRNVLDLSHLFPTSKYVKTSQFMVENKDECEDE